MSQLEKNTVSSKNQLNKSSCVSFINENGKGKKIMFVGNSITRHGYRPEIGWYGDYGMAASCEENDYVHILARRLAEKTEDPVICICQVAGWEREFANGSKLLDNCNDAAQFSADVIVMRIVENCPCPNEEVGLDVFCREYKALIDKLNSSGKAQIILTTGFWKHPLDEGIKLVAQERGYDCIYLGDLGEQDCMKAIGLFEHGGVANHPGDMGMVAIADAIEEKIKL